MIFRKKDPRQERRRYIRLKSVFPVQFQILSLDEAKSLSGCLQGFTSNISKGGICLQANNLIPALAEPLDKRRARLSLDIQMPLTGRSVRAMARIAWMQSVAGCPNSYLIGLSYEKIDPLQNSRLIRYAWTRKLIVPALLSAAIIFGLGFGLNTFISAKLIKGNITLVKQLVDIVQKSSIAKQKIKRINKEREDLQVRLQSLDLQIRTAEEEAEASAANKKELETLLAQLRQEKEGLQSKVIAIQGDETIITEELLQLDKIKTTLEEANLEKMYQWLKFQQNPRSGLVVSLAGSGGNKALCFTYEQALAAQAFNCFSDFARVRRLFNFFKNDKRAARGDFLSAYYADGTRPPQAVIANGANISLAIAIAQYTHKTKDRQYLNLAEDIASGIIALQQRDKNGGIPAGKTAGQYLAKDNLDAYALFNMLYKITGRKEYETAAAKALSWLADNIYDKNGIREREGADIVTDTYAWAIAAVGPQELEEAGINPERLIEFAEKKCRVKTYYLRPPLEAGDLEKSREDVIIVSEWAAQMVLAYKIIADYYYQKGMIAKARTYAMKSGDLMNELDKMIIPNLSAYGRGKSCLPYAAGDVVDSACGIKAQRNRTSGCVAGTVYALFAYYNYNPLEF